MRKKFWSFFKKKMYTILQIFFPIILNIKNWIYMEVLQPKLQYTQKGMSLKIRCLTFQSLMNTSLLGGIIFFYFLSWYYIDLNNKEYLYSCHLSRSSLRGFLWLWRIRRKRDSESAAWEFVTFYSLKLNQVVFSYQYTSLNSGMK